MSTFKNSSQFIWQKTKVQQCNDWIYYTIQYIMVLFIGYCEEILIGWCLIKNCKETLKSLLKISHQIVKSFQLQLIAGYIWHFLRFKQRIQPFSLFNIKSITANRNRYPSKLTNVIWLIKTECIAIWYHKSIYTLLAIPVMLIIKILQL